MPNWHAREYDTDDQFDRLIGYPAWVEEEPGPLAQRRLWVVGGIMDKLITLREFTVTEAMDAIGATRTGVTSTLSQHSSHFEVWRKPLCRGRWINVYRFIGGDGNVEIADDGEDDADGADDS